MGNLHGEKGSLSYFLKNEAKDIVDKHLRKKSFVFDDLVNDIWACFPKDTHPQDVMDGYGFIIDMLAEKHPEILIGVLSDESIPPDPTRVIVASALGRATPTKKAMLALRDAIQHKNREFSDAAERALRNLEYEAGPGFI